MVVVVQPAKLRNRNRNLVKMKLLRPLLQGSAFGLVFVDVVVDDDGLFYEHGLVRNSPEWNSAIGLKLSSAVERSLIVDCRRFSATSTLFSVIRIVRACDTLGISRHLKRDRALFVSRSISRANSISLAQCHRDNCQLLRRGKKRNSHNPVSESSVPSCSGSPELPVTCPN